MRSLCAIRCLFDRTTSYNELLSTRALLALMMGHTTFINYVLLICCRADISTSVIVIGANHVLRIGFDLQILHVGVRRLHMSFINISIAFRALLSRVLILRGQGCLLTQPWWLARFDEAVDRSIFIIISLVLILTIFNIAFYSWTRVSIIKSFSLMFLFGKVRFLSQRPLRLLLLLLIRCSICHAILLHGLSADRVGPRWVLGLLILDLLIILLLHCWWLPSLVQLSWNSASSTVRLCCAVCLVVHILIRRWRYLLVCYWGSIVMIVIFLLLRVWHVVRTGTWIT